MQAKRLFLTWQRFGKDKRTTSHLHTRGRWWGGDMWPSWPANEGPRGWADTGAGGH